MQTKLSINGEMMPGDGANVSVVDPATGVEVVSAAEASPKQINATFAGAVEAFESYARTPPAERAA